MRVFCSSSDLFFRGRCHAVWQAWSWGSSEDQVWQDEEHHQGGPGDKVAEPQNFRNGNRESFSRSKLYIVSDCVYAGSKQTRVSRSRSTTTSDTRHLQQRRASTTQSWVGGSTKCWQEKKKKKQYKYNLSENSINQNFEKYYTVC